MSSELAIAKAPESQAVAKRVPPSLTEEQLAATLDEIYTRIKGGVCYSAEHLRLLSINDIAVHAHTFNAGTAYVRPAMQGVTVFNSTITYRGQMTPGVAITQPIVSIGSVEDPVNIFTPPHSFHPDQQKQLALKTGRLVYNPANLEKEGWNSISYDWSLGIGIELLKNRAFAAYVRACDCLAFEAMARDPAVRKFYTSLVINATTTSPDKPAPKPFLEWLQDQQLPSLGGKDTKDVRYNPFDPKSGTQDSMGFLNAKALFRNPKMPKDQIKTGRRVLAACDVFVSEYDAEGNLVTRAGSWEDLLNKELTVGGAKPKFNLSLKVELGFAGVETTTGTKFRARWDLTKITIVPSVPYTPASSSCIQAAAQSDLDALAKLQRYILGEDEPQLQVADAPSQNPGKSTGPLIQDMDDEAAAAAIAAAEAAESRKRSSPTGGHDTEMAGAANEKKIAV